MNQDSILNTIAVYLQSIGNPTLPSNPSSSLSPTEFVAALNAANPVETKTGGTPTNPWAESKTSSNKNTVESSPEFQAFLAKITTAGFFKDFKQGTDDYKAAYDKALSKFTQKQAKKQAKKATPTLSKEEQHTKGIAFKNQGNEFLNNKDNEKALECYNQAINVCSDGKSSHIFYANAAAALINLQRYEEAAEMSGLSISCKDDYHKAHTRLGYAMIQMGDQAGAIASLTRALELSPGNSLATSHLGLANKMNGGVAPSNSMR